MWYSLEQLEDQLAILRDDDGKSVAVDKQLLPPQAKAGDIFRLQDGNYCYDADETIARKDRIRRLEQLLRGKKQEGTI